MLRVRGKGGRERAIPLSPTAARVLRSFRTDRQQRAATVAKLAVRPRARVIVQTDGRPVTPSTVNAWIERWLRHAGVPRRPGALAHAFRHTAADGWLDTGATVAEVQALLGHASVATTGIYTKARPASLADVTKTERYELSRSGKKTKDDDTVSRYLIWAHTSRGATAPSSAGNHYVTVTKCMAELAQRRDRWSRSCSPSSLRAGV